MSAATIEPPPGIELLPHAALRTCTCSRGGWAYHGELRGRAVLAPGYPSRSAACAAAWRVYVERGDDYRDLAEAVERGGLGSEGTIDMREAYVIALDRWPLMVADLLAQVLEDAGSLRRAGLALDMPRSTLGAWSRRYGPPQPSGTSRAGMPARYVVAFDQWTSMIAGLLTQVVEDAGSIRKAARALDVPRSTLGTQVKRYRERASERRRR